MRVKETFTNVVVVLIIVLAMVGYILHLPEVRFEKVNLRLKYQYDYIVKSYKPHWLSRSDIGGYPSSHFITSIPWISYNKSYCAAICLQMVAYNYGVKKSIEYFNFIMGFTYGAYLGVFDDEIFFIPGGDPFTGFVNASRILGFEYHLLVTDDKELFIDACKYFISRDIPIILPVNMSRLYNMKYFAPHFELLMGYEGDIFYLYEPVQSKHVFELGKRGYEFPADLVVKAVKDMSVGFNLPWKYSLIYFTKIGEPIEDLSDILIMNGKLQVGLNITMGEYAMYLGSNAFKVLGEYIKKGKVDIESIIWSINLALVSRIDNAKFLKEQFSGNDLAMKAANYLEEAAKLYREIINLSQNGITSKERIKIAEFLSKASEYEKEAGLLMIKAGS
ncbi:MAG: hypothetical protein DRO15_02840 [Thermoprotei archaeon]|nr:MAG: hypothetical protein DRO15_02840 [Thermoprotei archaeon]